MQKIEIEDVRRLDIHPGDWLVVKVAKGVTLQDRDYLYESLRAELGSDIRLLFVTPDIDLTVVHPVGAGALEERV